MTADERALLANCPAVPRSRAGTVGQAPKLRDNEGTDSLQNLARKVLARLGEWDRRGTTSPAPVPAPQPPVGQELRCPAPVPSPVSGARTGPAVTDWHERAAIIEFDGGIPRPLAEAMAVLEICPAGIEASRWQHAIDELARLLDGD
jgi:hypothetical protein